MELVSSGRRLKEGESSRYEGLLTGAGLAARCNQFFPVDGHIAWRLDADADLVSINPHNRDHNRVTDHDPLVLLPTKDKHGSLRSS
jgi:hypothetical protein